MKITKQQLIDKNACEDQIALFEELFGDEVEITPELCLSTKDKFDWLQVAIILLDEPNKNVHEKIMFAIYCKLKLQSDKR